MPEMIIYLLILENPWDIAAPLRVYPFRHWREVEAGYHLPFTLKPLYMSISKKRILIFQPSTYCSIHTDMSDPDDRSY
jgi:hypothetical protein